MRATFKTFHQQAKYTRSIGYLCGPVLRATEFWKVVLELVIPD